MAGLTGLTGLTLSWLYAQQDLDLRPLHRAGDEFGVVQPSELVDTAEFVQQGAVILTVGVALHTVDHAAYVRRLRDAGAVAIGFGIGLVEEQVPPTLLAAAVDCGIGLFEVPRRVPFAAILAVVQEEFARRRVREQQRLLDFQEVLNDIAVERGVADVVDTVGSYLDARVLIIDNDGRLLVGDATDAEELIGTALDLGGRNAAFTLGGRAVLVHRMSAEGDRFHLLVATSDRAFTAEGRSIVKHTAGLAEIILQRPLHLRRTAGELRTLAISLLLGVERGGPVMGEVFSSASDSSGRVRPVVVHAPTTAHRDRALAELDHRLMRAGRQLFSLHLRDSDTLILFRGSRTVAEIIPLFGDRARDVGIVIGDPLRWQDLTMGIVDELADLARTLRPGQRADPDTRVLRWVTDPAVRQALSSRFNETYRRLVDHDREHGGDLADTLDAYLRAGSKVAAAAGVLGVHRHTVRARLEMVEQVCGVSLDDPLVCAELLLLSLVRENEGT